MFALKTAIHPNGSCSYSLRKEFRRDAEGVMLRLAPYPISHEEINVQFPSPYFHDFGMEV